MHYGSSDLKRVHGPWCQNFDATVSFYKGRLPELQRDTAAQFRQAQLAMHQFHEKATSDYADAAHQYNILRATCVHFGVTFVTETYPMKLGHNTGEKLAPEISPLPWKSPIMDPAPGSSIFSDGY